jgi:hypothetical protein
MIFRKMGLPYTRTYPVSVFICNCGVFSGIVSNSDHTVLNE